MIEIRVSVYHYFLFPFSVIYMLVNFQFVMGEWELLAQLIEGEKWGVLTCWCVL